MTHFFKKPYFIAALVFAVLFIGTSVVRQGFAWTNPAGAPPFASAIISTLGNNVGVGTTNPNSKLEVFAPTLGSNVGDTVEVQRLNSSNGNNNYLDARNMRTAAGTDWNTAGTRIQEKVDSTWMGYLQFNGDSNNGGISFGTGLTTTPPGDVPERLRINSAGNMSVGTASPDANYKITTANGGIKADANTGQAAGYFNNIGGGPAIIAGTGGITLGGVNQTAWPSSGLGGSGTANYIPKWSAGSTLGNSLIYDNGTSVGIGTAIPGAKLDLGTSGFVQTYSSGGTGWGGSTNTAGFRTAWSSGYGASFEAWDGGAPKWGIYKWSANTPAVVMQGQYDSTNVNFTGNVGIGTTNPQAQLSVGGNGIANYGIYGKGAVSGIYGEGATGYGVFGYATTGTGVNGQSSSYRGVTGDSTTGTGGYFTSGSGYALITGNGNVGIGTANPVVRLDVAATANGNSGAFAGSVAIGSGMASDSTNVNMLNIRSTTSGTTHSIASFINSLNQSMFSMRDDGLTYFGGNVGIGTTASAYKLDVNGGMRLNGDINFTNANPYLNASSYFIAPGGAYFNSGTVYFDSAIQARGGVHNDTNTYLTISGGSSGSTYFSGKIGIGGTNPQSKLSVGGNGDVNASIYAEGSVNGVQAYGTNQGVVATGGNIGVYGITTGSYTVGVRGDASVTGSTGVAGYSTNGHGVYGQSSNASYYGVYGYNGAGGWGIYCGGTSCGGNRAWSIFSDERLKKNIVTIPNPLEKVLKLRGVSFQWKDGGQSDMGFIAQEAKDIIPEVVDKNQGEYYTMRTSSITGLLVEAMKEQQKQIDELKSELGEMKK